MGLFQVLVVGAARGVRVRVPTQLSHTHGGNGRLGCWPGRVYVGALHTSLIPLSLVRAKGPLPHSNSDAGCILVGSTTLSVAPDGTSTVTAGASMPSIDVDATPLSNSSI